MLQSNGRYWRFILNRKLIALTLSLFAFSTLVSASGSDKVLKDSCKNWRDTATNDYQVTSSCMQDYLKKYQQNEKKIKHNIPQTYDLPVISSFPANRMMG